MVKAGRRQIVAERLEKLGDVPVEARCELLVAGAALVVDRAERKDGALAGTGRGEGRGKAKFLLDDLLGDDLLGIKGGQSAGQVFKFADVAGPGVAL